MAADKKTVKRRPGRPLVIPGGTANTVVTLGEHDRRLLADLGDGNRSRGLRRVLEWYRQRQKRRKSQNERERSQV